ncbi:MAG: SGNH/GDSL hydrolase family protein [Acidobacteriota bacterium]|nr:SGNH/GDSL hydrolase family protein [Acidobacteriota bacterium]MDH3784862.1 SGNH/GDSL hydrolase family protein [Acidobacteriota bacterium]
MSDAKSAPARRSFRSRLRRVAQIALLLAGSLTIMLLLAEVATRLLSDIGPPIRVRDREIGNRYRRNHETERFVPEGDRVVALRFNRDGFRGPDREPLKPENTCRVAVIGDSHIAAIATPEEQTLVSRLETLLEDGDTHRRWEVFNYGVSGGSTAQEMVVYQKIASRYDPDIVVLAFFDGNDLSDNSHELSSSPRIYMELDSEGRLRQRALSARINPYSAWLGRNSRFYVWQKHSFRILKANLRKKSRVLGPPRRQYAYSTEGRKDVERAWRLTEALLTTFRDQVESDGRRFLLVVIPTGDRMFADIWEAGLGRLEHVERGEASRRLREIVDRGAIDTVFLEEPYERHIAGRESDDEAAWVHFNSDGHINERGSEIAAEAIRDRLSVADPQLSDCSQPFRPAQEPL